MDRPRISGFSYSFFYPIPFALCMLIVRHFLERYCFEPIGISLGIKAPRVKYNGNNSELISTLKSTNLLSPAQVSNVVSSLNKHLNISNIFFKNKSESNQKIFRFSRSCWHFTYYLVEFIHGIVILWDKPWLWDILECWTGYPHQKVTTDVWFYYVMTLAYYWSLLIKVLTEEKRKDFTETVVHHVLAIFLIYISYEHNFFRIGSIVIIILFVSDIFLELAKLFKYLELDDQATICFGFFSLVWTISRLIIYPFWILKHTLVDAHGKVNLTMTPIMYLLNVLLCSVAVLNIFWTFHIYRLVWKALTGQEINDDRSDNDETDSEENDSKKKS